MLVHDCHCHFFSRSFFDALVSQAGHPGPDAGRKAVQALGWEYPESDDTLASRWVVELDRHQVGRAALIASAPGDEHTVAAAVKEHPGRFVGFFLVDPRQSDSKDRVRLGLSRHGLQAVCLFPAMQGFRLDDPCCLDIFETVAESGGSAVFVHCGFLSVGIRKKLGLPGWLDIRLGNPLDLLEAASRFPDLPILLPHFGAGLLREALMLADARPNVFFDTSSSNSWVKYHPGLTLQEVFHQVLQVVGSERLLFGTDSSFFPRGWQLAVYEDQRRILNELGVDEESQSLILRKNFDRLFGPVDGA